MNCCDCGQDLKNGHAPDCLQNSADDQAMPKRERMADRHVPLPYWTPPPPAFKRRREKKPKTRGRR